MTPQDLLVPFEQIERSILLILGEKVMLDFDLAKLYGVETRTLAQAVKRNMERFPEDFMFQLTKEELENWRSQFVMSNPGAKMGLRRPPYAFTEQGVAMLSSVLRSQRAVQVNIEIMRAFVRLRQMLASHADLARKLDALERKYDRQFKGSSTPSSITMKGQSMLSIREASVSVCRSPARAMMPPCDVPLVCAAITAMSTRSTGTPLAVARRVIFSASASRLSSRM